MRFKLSKSGPRMLRIVFSILTISVLATFTAGCKDKTQTGSTYAPADGSEETPSDDTEFKLNADGTDPNAVNADGSPMTREQQIDALFGVARMLDSRSTQVKFGQMLLDQKELVKIADRLMLFELDDRKKVIAFQIKIRALLRLHSTSDRKAREELISLTKEFINSDNDEVVKFCYAGELNLKTQDFLRLEGEDFTALREKVDEATKRFPNSTQIANECLAVILQLLSRDRRDAAIEMMKLMQTNFAKATDPQVVSISGSLSDKIYLADIRFDQVVGNLQGGFAGADTKYLEAGRKMAQLKNMGPSIYAEVNNVARWLEQSGSTKKAGEMLETMNASLKKGNNKELQASGAKALTRFKARSGLLGKSFTIAGRDRAAVEFDMKAIENKVTMVYFWSTTKPASIQPLASFLPLYAAYQDRGLEIVTYCIDPDADNANTMFGSNPPPWQNLFLNEKNKNHTNMLRDSGIQFLPYVILMDRDGKVTDINVPLTMIQPKLEPLLGPAPARDASPEEDNSSGDEE